MSFIFFKFFDEATMSIVWLNYVLVVVQILTLGIVALGVPSIIAKTKEEKLKDKNAQINKLTERAVTAETRNKQLENNIPLELARLEEVALKDALNHLFILSEKNKWPESKLKELQTLFEESYHLGITAGESQFRSRLKIKELFEMQL